jgi:hypothetical protein
MVVDMDDTRHVGGGARPVAHNDADEGKGTRSSLRKRKTPPASKQEGGNGRPRPRPRRKPKQKSAAKELASKLDSQSRSRSLPQDQRMLNYFEEIAIDGGSRLANIYDLTQDMVCLLSNTISALLN